MDFSSREQIINHLQQSFQIYLNQFEIDDIGIFEEEGQGDQYFLGYTIKKNEKTYHIHTPYIKNHSGALAPSEKGWIVETDNPQGEDLRGFQDIESAFQQI